MIPITSVEALSFWCPFLNSACFGEKCMKWKAETVQSDVHSTEVRTGLDGVTRAHNITKLQTLRTGKGTCGYK